jgi:hypothetical protein
MEQIKKTDKYTQTEKDALKKLSDIFFFKNIYDRFNKFTNDLPNSKEAISSLEANYTETLDIINKHNTAKDYDYKKMFTKRLFDRYIDKKTEIVIENDLT